MTIRVDKKLANALKIIAREKGINYSTLARMWLIERVKKEMEEMKKIKQITQAPPRLSSWYIRLANCKVLAHAIICTRLISKYWQD